MEKSPSWKLTDLQLVKKFPAFYGTRRFITAFTSAHQLSLSWTSSTQSIPPHPTSLRSILILSSHLRLGVPSGHFPSGFPTKTLYTPLPSPYVLHALPISFFSILSTEEFCARSNNNNNNNNKLQVQNRDRDRWRAVMNAVINFRVPYNVGNFLTSCKIVSFSRTLLNAISKQVNAALQATTSFTVLVKNSDFLKNSEICVWRVLHLNTRGKKTAREGGGSESNGNLQTSEKPTH